MNHIEHHSDDVLPTHHCDTCDACLSTFFTRVQLSEVVDVQAILSDPQLRQSLVNFYQSAVQYTPPCPHPLLTNRLAVKATWDENFKERAFENCFYTLDWFTAKTDYPRKGETVVENPMYNGDVTKRRKVE